MNSSENIRNAVNVLYNTYDNVEKLMEYCKVTAEEKTDYRSSVPKFLRYKSDNDTSAWLLNDFILLFQNNTDNNCESGNGWKDGPVYVMEIYLGGSDYDKEDYPSIFLSKFEYENINGWSEGCSPANHWVFYHPLRNKNYMDIKKTKGMTVATPQNEKASRTYWGLKKVIGKKLDLMEVTSENVKEKIFGSFDELAALV